MQSPTLSCRVAAKHVGMEMFYNVNNVQQDICMRESEQLVRKHN